MSTVVGDPVVYIGDCWGLVLLCGSGILIGIVEISKLRSCCRNVWFTQDKQLMLHDWDLSLCVLL